MIIHKILKNNLVYIYKYKQMIKPGSNSSFVIYSKSGCVNCTRVKTLIHENAFKFTVVDCDEYLLENKDGFLAFIESIAGKPYKTFPMVFYDGTFVGGLLDTMHFIDTRLK